MATFISDSELETLSICVFLVIAITVTIAIYYKVSIKRLLLFICVSTFMYIAALIFFFSLFVLVMIGDFVVFSLLLLLGIYNKSNTTIILMLDKEFSILALPIDIWFYISVVLAIFGQCRLIFESRRYG